MRGMYAVRYVMLLSQLLYYRKKYMKINENYLNKKTGNSQLCFRFDVQGTRESNSHQRFWRPLSCHLTSPLYMKKEGNTYLQN